MPASGGLLNQIDIPPALLERMLKNREHTIRNDLLRVGSADRMQAALLEKQAADIQSKLHNMEVALVACKQLFATAYEALDRLGQGLPVHQLRKALQALLVGDIEPAEQLFTAIRAKFPQQAAEATFQLAELAYNRIDYLPAFKLYAEAVDLQPDNPLYQNEAGYLAKTIGRYHDAETYYQRALRLWEERCGAEHVDVANSLNNLAGLYFAQGLYGRAEPMYTRALLIREKLLGEMHLEVAVSVTNLGLLNVSLRRYSKAEQFYQRALLIREAVLGEQHVDIAVSLGHLAGLYKTQGSYAKAVQCYLRALAIFEQALGPDHASVASLLNSLAGLYKAQRAYAKAEPLFHRALNINRQVLGVDHPFVEASMVNYASLRKMMSRMPD
jgi:tetratricopeptide (TPR) repeat protein